ncbi:recombinase family protein [Paenibacillus xylanexedens]|uniref:recombinase family protein n=1 Tax=Paenibacillus xylanexedens TaxID=528191 RepID=UPI0028E2E4A8|nr:recombinase family protein [Paenibacillus xylanexedens]
MIYKLKFGYDRVYTEKASGGKDDRPELAKVLDMLCEGDTFIVYKLDRLASSTLKLIETLMYSPCVPVYGIIIMHE